MGADDRQLGDSHQQEGCPVDVVCDVLLDCSGEPVAAEGSAIGDKGRSGRREGNVADGDASNVGSGTNRKPNR